MFAQLIRCRIKPEAWDRLRALDERWQREQAPIAPGFKGSYILREQGSPDGDKIMHSQLEADNGFTLMASDTPAGMQHNPGDNIAVSLSGDDAEALRGYWQKLSDGGTVTMPLEKQMWGDEFGMCVDRFGVPWMVNITQQA